VNMEQLRTLLKDWKSHGLKENQLIIITENISNKILQKQTTLYLNSEEQILSFIENIKNKRCLRIDAITNSYKTSLFDLNCNLEQIKRYYFFNGIAFDPDLTRFFLQEEINANSLFYAGIESPNSEVNLKN